MKPTSPSDQGNGESISDASPTGASPSEPAYQRVTHWMPILVQIVGLTVIIYESVFNSLDRPGVLAAGITLAIGGKLSDILRTGGL